ncbi:transposase [Chelativorans xinjiangense]|uniref:transposase n=1 Tax=Chelativorans xinjiangense TaxID=2681485 RepID=UPI001357D24E|nr:transposase [Chelativorans xinjiangense]
MLGERTVVQEALFYEFSIERHVPADHPLRAIDRFVDLSELRVHLRPFYSEIGRPSIDPELMIRMLLVGYIRGIRSERRLCEEVHLNLAYRWFCRLDLTDAVPDHSTFSKNRHGRFRESDLFRRLFESVVERCIAECLVGGERFAVDASLIRADANKQNATPIDDWPAERLNPGDAPRAVREYLDTLDDAAFGAATEVKPKFTSHADPASQWTGAQKGPAFFAYADNYLIDTDHAIIVDVEATRAVRQAETGAARTMIDRTLARFGLYPEALVADTAYGSADMLGWLVHEHGIEPHIPVFDKSERRDGTFSNTDFRFDRDADEYTCPGGNRLKKYWRTMTKVRTGICKDGFIRYYASKKDCSRCALKAQCTPNQPARKIARHIHEGARNLAREITSSDAYVASSRARKKVEMLFAHLKRILKLDRLRLRGPNGARDEFHLAATAQNLRKLAKLVPTPA